MKKLEIDIWSDVVCPWCYVGKRRLEAALEKFPHKDEVAITWRAFELDPSAPRVRDDSESPAERLAKKYGRSVPEMKAMMAQTASTAAKEGLDFHLDTARSGNTFDAHRLIHFATERGRGDEMKERLLHAYMTEGEAIGEVDTLIRLGAGLGWDEAELRTMFESGAYTKEVRTDEAEAQANGIRGVPFFVFGGKYAVSGAQPAELFQEVLEKAWSERPPEIVEGQVCGPDGCA